MSTEKIREEQREANQFDLDLFRLMSRAHNLALKFDPIRAPTGPLGPWGKVVGDLAMARDRARSRMSEKDLRETRGGRL